VTLPDTVYVVTRVNAWSSLSVHGTPLSPPNAGGAPGPVGFLPVFTDKAVAEAWAGDPTLVLAMTNQKPA